MIKENIIAMLLIGCVCAAQAETMRSLKLKGMEPDIPEYIEPYEGDVTLDPEKQKKVLPRVDTQKDKQQLSLIGRVFVKKINIVGNKLMPASILDAIISPYENRSVTTEELNKLRNDISIAFYQQGYINSGVILPDQKVKDGIVDFKVIQGKLTGIHITDNEYTRSRFFSKRIEVHQGEYLRLNEIQTGLQILQQHPLVERLNARLLPGAALGEAELSVKLTERIPYQIALAYDNHRSPSVGAERASLVMYHRSLTGRGDMLSAEFGNTDGLQDISTGYSIPINRNDTTIDVSYSSSDSIVVEEPFNIINIESESESISAGISHPFVKQLNRELTGRLRLEKKHSQSSILGIPFSFSPGVINGESTVAMLSAGVDWLKRDQQQVLALGFQVKKGIDALGSSINSGLPDSEFMTLNGQLQFARRFDWRFSQMVIKSGFQLAQDSLLPDVKYSIGGSQTVRGYRENQYVRDSGALLSLEYRTPLLIDDANRIQYGLQLVPFIDYGTGWDDDDSLPTSSKSKLMSIGMGLVWEPTKKFHAELYWASRREDVPNPDTDLQDDGIHFLLRYEFIK